MNQSGSEGTELKPRFELIDVEELSKDPGWLSQQPCLVIGVGSGQPLNADVVVESEEAASILTSTIERFPFAAFTLVQVLRAVEHLGVQDGLTVESLAYGVLQSGPEHQAWLASRSEEPQLVSSGADSPIRVFREGNIISASLNRPENRNSLTVEMRDALIELFQLVKIDDSVQRLDLRGEGSCFSVGGELVEFGLTSDSCHAHMIRSIHSPSRLLAAISDRVHCHLHSACVGSGIELPAFAGTVTANRKSFFQLPELKYGLIPGAGGCVSISRRIGRHRTAWMALSGRKINVEVALDWGLVDEIVELDSLINYDE